jgi:uncharacterized membrane protein
MWFAAMLADEQIIIFLFSISSSSGRRNAIGFCSYLSSSLILLGFSSGLTIIKFQHSSKPYR